MRQNWMTPAAEAVDRGEKGGGCMAIAPIRAGEVVAAFGGWVVTRGYSRPFAGRLHDFVFYERNAA